MVKIRHPRLPLPELRVFAREIPSTVAGRDFFFRDTRQVARELLGAWFVRKVKGELYGARLVEVEAYLGEKDAAAHSYKGRRTARVEPMYDSGGHLYVFQVYGIHFCANVVTREEGVAQAVLIRAASHPRLPPNELSGPGKFCKIFGIRKELSGADLANSSEFEIRPDPVSAGQIQTSPRIGVDYAGAARHWRLRYSLKGDPAVTRPR